MNRELFDRMKSYFFQRLDEKTNWGKEQVKSLYLESVAKACMVEADAVQTNWEKKDTLDKEQQEQWESQQVDQYEAQKAADDDLPF